MGYLRMAPFSASGASSLCLRRTFGFSQSQLSFGKFARNPAADRHHAVLLGQWQRELLSVSVRPKQIRPACNPNYLPMAPSSAASGASSPCLRRTFGFSQSQLSFGQFAAVHHAVLLGQRQRESLSVSVRPKQIQLLIRPACTLANRLGPESEPVTETSIFSGTERLKHAVSGMKIEPKNKPHEIQQMMEALVMLKELAADGDKRQAMRNSMDLLSIVMAPLSSVPHRTDDHGAWSGLAAASLELMCLLLDDPSPPSPSWEREIARNQEEIKTNMNGIIECDKCDEQLRALAKKILAQVGGKH